MNECRVTVSCASPQRLGSPFDYRECVFSVSDVPCFDGSSYEVTCRMPLCEEGLTDSLVVLDGKYQCRDMKDEMRSFMSGKVVGKWRLENSAKKRFEDLLTNSSIPPLFNPSEAVIKYDHEGLDWFRLTISAPYFMNRENLIAWNGTYEWHGRLTGKWKPLQDLVDLVTESSSVHRYELREKEKFYESFIHETIEKQSRCLKRRRSQLLLHVLFSAVIFLIIALAAFYLFKA